MTVMTVVVMRPRDGEEVVQIFTPDHHAGDITIMHRLGHFNSTEVVEWSLNERGRRCMKRAAVVLFKLRMAQEVARRLSAWKQMQLHNALELDRARASSTMYYQNWEVVLEGWNGGVRVLHFYYSDEARLAATEELQGGGDIGGDGGADDSGDGDKMVR